MTEAAIAALLVGGDRMQKKKDEAQSHRKVADMMGIREGR